MFQTKVVEEIKTHILPPNFFFNNLAVYEIMCKKQQMHYCVSSVTMVTCILMRHIAALHVHCLYCCICFAHLKYAYRI